MTVKVGQGRTVFRFAKAGTHGAAVVDGTGIAVVAGCRVDPVYAMQCLVTQIVGARVAVVAGVGIDRMDAGVSLLIAAVKGAIVAVIAGIVQTDASAILAGILNGAEFSIVARCPVFKVACFTYRASRGAIAVAFHTLAVEAGAVFFYAYTNAIGAGVTRCAGIVIGT